MTSFTAGAPSLSSHNICKMPESPSSSNDCASIKDINDDLVNSQEYLGLYEQEDIFDRKQQIETLKCLWANCSRVFTQLDEFTNHVNDVHMKAERETNYICRWEGCNRNGKAFNARYKMLIHVRTHTHEKPHTCSECGKPFSRLENLKIHNRSHTGEKPYICSVNGCTKAYSNSSDRFKHTRTHFVDKPYVCRKNGCNKRYTDPSSLRKHMKTYGHYREDTAKVVTSNAKNNFCIPKKHLTCQESESVENPKLLSAPAEASRSPKGGNVLCETPLELTLNVASLISSNVLQIGDSVNDELQLSANLDRLCDPSNIFSTVQHVAESELREHEQKGEVGPLDLTVNQVSGDANLDTLSDTEQLFS